MLGCVVVSEWIERKDGESYPLRLAPWRVAMKDDVSTAVIE